MFVGIVNRLNGLEHVGMKNNVGFVEKDII